MIKDIYENAIRQIENERQRDIEIAKQKAMQESIVPFNRDIDNSLRDAVAELQTQHNEKISQLQKAFEAEKAALAEAAENKKKQFAETTIATANSVINANADNAIQYLRKFIDEQGA